VIRGHKPSAHFATADGEGHRIEGECRMCAHCNYTWEYKPGSGITRGYCVKCDGWLCGRAECALLQRQMLAYFHLEYGCVPFGDYNKRLLEQYAHDPRFNVLPSGIVVAVDFRN
jgi:hypothetical protein